MATHDITALARKAMAALDTGPSEIKRWLTEDFVDHSPFGEADRDGMIARSQQIHDAFPDWTVVVEDVFASGDRAALRLRMYGTHKGSFLGAPPTGRKVGGSDLKIMRFRDGRLAEMWSEWDTASFLQQLGVLPAAASPMAR
jgi:steroid delta-isomerase-like uncharacterized protein